MSSIRAPSDLLKSACWLHTEPMIARYLMANAEGRWDGAEKAQRHGEMCSFYVALVYGIQDPDRAQAEQPEACRAVRRASRALTDNLDQVIGFPLRGKPDYAVLAPKFFEHFHKMALETLLKLWETQAQSAVDHRTDDRVILYSGNGLYLKALGHFFTTELSQARAYTREEASAILAGDGTSSLKVMLAPPPKKPTPVQQRRDEEPTIDGLESHP